MDILLKMEYSETRKGYINPHKLTKYPKIFQGVYWSGHSFDEREMEEVRMLCENRNSLVEEYNIVKRITDVPKKYFQEIGRAHV